MNVICIHRVPFKKPCEACGRDGVNGISDEVRSIAEEMVCERLMIERSYEDVKALRRLTTIEGISLLTGLSEGTIRKIEKRLREKLWRQDTFTREIK